MDNKTAVVRTELDSSLFTTNDHTDSYIQRKSLKMQDTIFFKKGD